MSFRNRIENNMTLFVLSIAFAGFVFGLSTYKGIMEIAQLETISKDELKKLKNYSIGKDTEIDLFKINIEKLKEKISILENKYENEKTISADDKRKHISQYREKEQEMAISQAQIDTKGTKDKEIKDSTTHNKNKMKTKLFYKNDFLLIEVVHSKKIGEIINLDLKHTNISEQVIKIRLKANGDTFLLDDKNNTYNHITNHYNDRKDLLYFSGLLQNKIELVPNIPRIISFQFSGSSESYGNFFDFSSLYEYYINNLYSYNPIYISIKGIHLN